MFARQFVRQYLIYGSKTLILQITVTSLRWARWVECAMSRSTFAQGFWTSVLNEVNSLCVSKCAKYIFWNGSLHSD